MNWMKKQDLKLNALSKWLSSKDDFNEAAKLINDIRADTNNVKKVLVIKSF